MWNYIKRTVRTFTLMTEQTSEIGFKALQGIDAKVTTVASEQLIESRKKFSELTKGMSADDKQAIQAELNRFRDEMSKV